MTTNPTMTSLDTSRFVLNDWLTNRRNNGATPPEITKELISSGWTADAASSAALTSLRKADKQDLLWFSLCWSAGLAAVGFSTAAHQLLSEYPDRPVAAFALTVSLVMAPIAILCGWYANNLEYTSKFAVWSPSRRIWFGTLACCTAVVGLVRLISYLNMLVSSFIAPRGTAPLYGGDFAQVMVSLSVAVPLFAWSFLQWRRSNVAIDSLATNVEQ